MEGYVEDCELVTDCNVRAVDFFLMAAFFFDKERDVGVGLRAVVFFCVIFLEVAMVGDSCSSSFRSSPLLSSVN